MYSLRISKWVFFKNLYKKNQNFFIKNYSYSQICFSIQKTYLLFSDGDKTSTKGPCDCGFRHHWHGTEVDFVTDYLHPGHSKGIPVGINVNSMDFEECDVIF